MAAGLRPLVARGIVADEGGTFSAGPDWKALLDYQAAPVLQLLDGDPVAGMPHPAPDRAAAAVAARQAAADGGHDFGKTAG
jgi:hypothetical protein